MLKVNTIYQSISGEVSIVPQGTFITLIRLSGCNCNCSYCDALEARNGIGKNVSIDEICEQIRKFNNKNILITGGEPLLQKDGINNLISKLDVSNIIIETNGTINPAKMPFFDKVNFVIDYKMPFSGCFSDMKFENFLNLKESDIIKFVCDSFYDVKTALDINYLLNQRGCRAQRAIGQTYNWLKNGDFNLVKYLIENGEKNFIMNFQIHKFLNAE